MKRMFRGLMYAPMSVFRTANNYPALLWGYRKGMPTDLFINEASLASQSDLLNPPLSDVLVGEQVDFRELVAKNVGEVVTLTALTVPEHQIWWSRLLRPGHVAKHRDVRIGELTHEQRGINSDLKAFALDYSVLLTPKKPEKSLRLRSILPADIGEMLFGIMQHNPRLTRQHIASMILRGKWVPSGNNKSHASTLQLPNYDENHAAGLYNLATRRIDGNSVEQEVFYGEIKSGEQQS